jgi:hypothetical protein
VIAAKVVLPTAVQVGSTKFDNIGREATGLSTGTHHRVSGRADPRTAVRGWDGRMFTYADPRVCPSCRRPLPRPTAPDHRCATCGVPVGHPAAAAVYTALQRTDELVAQLRAARWQEQEPRAAARVPAYAAAAAGPAASTTPTAPTAPNPPAPPATRTFVPTVPVPRRTGVRGSSIPVILLSLGALCLIVAAVIFLAVAWSWLGLGGRTAVLVGLTAAAGGTARLLEGRRLRLAAEALASVALGMVVLDVVGAERAGWLDVGGHGLAVAIGLALTAAGAVLASGERRLVVPQLAGVVGLFTAVAALPGVLDGQALLVAAAGVAGLMGVAATARRCDGLAVTTWAAVGAAALTWCDLTLTALVGLGDLDGLTLADLWTSTSGYGLLAAALLLLTPRLVSRDEVVLQVSTTASATMLTALVALPVLDDGATSVALASLAAGSLWTAVAYAVARRRLAVPLVPAVLSLVPGGAIAAVLVGQALDSVTTPTGALVLAPSEPVASPYLLVPTVVAVAALALVVVPMALRRTGFARVVLAAALLAATATLALHPVPLWTVVAALTATAAAYAAEALRRDDAAALVQVLAALTVLALTLPIAEASTALLTMPLAALTAAAAGVLVVGRFATAAEIGGMTLPPVLAGLAWVVGDLAGLDATRAVPVLVVLAATMMVLPRVEVETTAMLAGAVAALSAVTLAADESLSLSLHLVLAGALLVAHSLVHASRRPLAWAGSVLIMLGTWVRLWSVDSSVTELYTMPPALLLLAIGLVRMRRDAETSTAVALTPGLLLATVPSLVHVVATDPVSVRAAVLGIACVVLAVGGAQLRWSAPLLVGAGVGTLLLLAETAPYAAATPQWVVIGLAGTVLVVVGTTWERRVVDVRRAATYVGRLR